MTPSSQPENREQPIMSNTKQQIEEMLNKVSEYNKLSGKGHGDLKDNCYICGISPSGLIEAIDRLVTEARMNELRKIRIKQFDPSQGDYELGWNELRHGLRCHIKDRLAQLKNNTTKQEEE